MIIRRARSDYFLTKYKSSPMVTYCVRRRQRRACAPHDIILCLSTRPDNNLIYVLQSYVCICLGMTTTTTTLHAYRGREKKNEIKRQNLKWDFRRAMRPPVREGHRRRGDNGVKTRVPTIHVVCTVHAAAMRSTGPRRQLVGNRVLVTRSARSSAGKPRRPDLLAAARRLFLSTRRLP